MKNGNLKIQVSEQVFEAAKAGRLRSITSNLDPEADIKLLQDGVKPETVSLKARGTRKHPVTFQVVGTDRVLEGYKVQTTDGHTLCTMVRTTGRVVIGQAIDSKTDTEDEPKEDVSE